MKQITDKLNKIAQAIDESVELPTTDLIIDSLDAITKAYGGTPNDSNLIVDKLEAIAGVAHGGDSIPKCTVTFNNDIPEEQHIASYIGDYICLSNGAILKNIDTVQPSESATYTFMYQKDGDSYYIGYNSEAMTLTNMVNCEEIAEGDWAGYISPIDETLDSSFTITAEILNNGGLE